MNSIYELIWIPSINVCNIIVDYVDIIAGKNDQPPPRAH